MITYVVGVCWVDAKSKLDAAIFSLTSFNQADLCLNVLHAGSVSNYSMVKVVICNLMLHCEMLQGTVF